MEIMQILTWCNMLSYMHVIQTTPTDKFAQDLVYIPYLSNHVTGLDHTDPTWLNICRSCRSYLAKDV